MRYFLSSMTAGALALSGLFLSADADACGGCFHIQQSEGGQVSGHRMIFSVSNDQTTLWDQISYQGAPESFAWVLPIRGQVEVGLSSDALFEQLESATAVQVLSPEVSCGPQTCFERGGGGGGGGGEGTDSVTVIAQETVGPFETVQLSSSDPAALEDWLLSHGYAIPDNIVPIISAYVNEGFDFLAMRLAPGEGLNSMRPVRVTSPGAGLALPLRMVAAGTGAITPITLWIVAEGRYEPTNFPSFTIPLEDVVWNWDTKSSNYSLLKQWGFDATQNKGWLVEAAFKLTYASVEEDLGELVQTHWQESGYGDSAEDAIAAAQEDLAAFSGTLDPDSAWITRLHGQLSQDALAEDLFIGASANQVTVDPLFRTKKTTGTRPSCPPPPDCDIQGEGACAVGTEAPAFGAALAALGLAAALRKRRGPRRSA